MQSYQVLQRDADDKARVQTTNGEVLELAVGGPYTIGDAHNVLVGDIWVLAGQSNMEGIGDLIDEEKPSPFVHSFQSREEWAQAEEPLHWLDESPRLVHHVLWGRDRVEHSPVRDPQRVKGTGLGLTFAKERYARTGVPVGLIPSAHGGTSMEQWDPQLRDQGSASLYGALCERVKAVGGKVAGVLWYQGESDCNPEGVEHYHQRMLTLIQALRSDLGSAELPFYYVQIGGLVSEGTPVGWHGIREAQRTLQNALPGIALVSAIDLELDDLIHIGTQGLKRLGRRLADIADGQRTPDVLAVTPELEQSRIHITYRPVRAGLHAPGRPTGFTLRSNDERELPLIHKTTLEGNTVTLHLIANELPAETSLWYGWGHNPYCNITDGADAAIPAFGPWKL
ncbi:sialate O-acetylesterase [Dictyobacter kobayashii]|uniref:sialate O-acetylesterase n=1 Tax=Dictyobacter kobayashii TaxID=2014872 RepID=UPI001FE4120C|nr:sialate O-acetylesterase [Dictyobacter kobayashii]